MVKLSSISTKCHAISIICCLIDPDTGDPYNECNSIWIENQVRDYYMIVNTSIGPITIAHYPDHPITFYGAVDEFRIYNKELSQSEINEINNYVIIE